jgi:hypothetical protein
MRYAMENLIRAANEAGFDPTPRLVQDWVARGLLDRPERHGRGRGKGVSATWSEEQRGLFCSLLDKRRSVNQVAPLCNIPVWTWLYFGDTYVSLRQVRRALNTWGEQKASWTTAKRTAQQVLGDASHPRARFKDKQAFLEAAARMFLHPSRAFDEEVFLPLLKCVFDPKETGLSRTLGGMEFTPEAFIEIMKARMRALNDLAGDRIDDSLFHWARYTNIVARAGYQWQLAHMTTAGTATGLTLPGIDTIVLTACRDLLTILGLGLGMPGGAATLSRNHPSVWKAKGLRSIVHGEPDAGGVKVTLKVYQEKESGDKETGQ